MTTHSEGHRARLRERFRRSGLQGFSDHEILELLLTLCIPRKDVKPQAKALLGKFGSVGRVLDASHESIEAIEGLGESAATCLSILKELAAYYLQEKTKRGPLFKNNEELVNFWKLRLGNLTYEVFEVAYLDQHYRLMDDGIERLEEGTVNRTVVYPRKVICSALKRGASHIVIAHNHPSGDPSPSQNDLQLTQTLKYVGEILSLRLLDHMIVGQHKVYSFRQEGFLE
jgi:DNA repair protein RadC